MTETGEQSQGEKAVDGRKKIKIARITNPRSRQVTFLKRKNGLLKKAMELGVLCDCEVTVIVFNVNNGKLFEFSSVPMEKALQRYATYSGPSERRTTDKFFDVAAAKGTTNIPLNEPNVAQAAIEAATAATRRPRPFHKFNSDAPTNVRVNGKRLSSGETPPAIINPQDCNPFAITPADVPVSAAEQRPTKFRKPNPAVEVPEIVQSPTTGPNTSTAAAAAAATAAALAAVGHNVANVQPHTYPHFQAYPDLPSHPPPHPVQLHTPHPPPAMARPPVVSSVTPQLPSTSALPTTFVASTSADISASAVALPSVCGPLSAFLGLSPTASKDDDIPNADNVGSELAAAAVDEASISKNSSEASSQHVSEDVECEGDLAAPTTDTVAAVAVENGLEPLMEAPEHQGANNASNHTLSTTCPPVENGQEAGGSKESDLPSPWMMNDGEAPPAAIRACRTDSSHGIVAGMKGLSDSEKNGQLGGMGADNSSTAADAAHTATAAAAVLASRCTATGSEGFGMRLENAKSGANDACGGGAAALGLSSTGLSSVDKVDTVGMPLVDAGSDGNTSTYRKSFAMVEPLPSLSRNDVLKDEIVDTTASGLQSLVTPGGGEDNTAFPASLSLSRMPSNLSTGGGGLGGAGWTWVNNIFAPVIDTDAKDGAEQVNVQNVAETSALNETTAIDSAVVGASAVGGGDMELATPIGAKAGTAETAATEVVDASPACGLDPIGTTPPETAVASFMETDLALSRTGSNDSSGSMGPLLLRSLSGMPLQPLQPLVSRGLSLDTFLGTGGGAAVTGSAEGDELAASLEATAGADEQPANKS